MLLLKTEDTLVEYIYTFLFVEVKRENWIHIPRRPAELGFNTNSWNPPKWGTIPDGWDDWNV